MMAKQVERIEQDKIACDAALATAVGLAAVAVESSREKAPSAMAEALELQKKIAEQQALLDDRRAAFDAEIATHEAEVAAQREKWAEEDLRRQTDKAAAAAEAQRREALAAAEAEAELQKALAEVESRKATLEHGERALEEQALADQEFKRGQGLHL